MQQDLWPNNNNNPPHRPENNNIPPIPINNPTLLNSQVKLTKKMKQNKGQYKKQLESENTRLKAEILELQNQVLIKEAENQTLRNQLNFFHSVKPENIEENSEK